MLFLFRLRLVRVKVFPKNRYFPEMLFSERKMFSCVWLHFKKCFGKYFLMFGCVLENTIDNTFSTCCSHFLTFSLLPNEYIISFIPQNTNKTQKKSSNPNKRRRDCERRDHDRRDRSFAQLRSTRSRDAPIAINAFAVLVMSAPRRPRCR